MISLGHPNIDGERLDVYRLLMPIAPMLEVEVGEDAIIDITERVEWHIVRGREFEGELG
jgi:hypothetical protein